MGICLGLFPAVRTFHWPASTVVAILVTYNALFGFPQGVVVWVYLSEFFRYQFALEARAWQVLSTGLPMRWS